MSDEKSPIKGYKRERDRDRARNYIHIVQYILGRCMCVDVSVLVGGGVKMNKYDIHIWNLKNVKNTMQINVLWNLITQPSHEINMMTNAGTCVSVCVCVCVYTSIFVRTNLSFRPWEWIRTFLVFKGLSEGSDLVWRFGLELGLG